MIVNINRLNGNKTYLKNTKKVTIILTSKNQDFIARTKQILDKEKIKFEYKLQ